MNARRTTRGDLILVLNRLVSEGAILSFRTSMFGAELQGELIVTITAPDASAGVEAQRVTERALAPLGVEVVVQVDLP